MTPEEIEARRQAAAIMGAAGGRARSVNLSPERKKEIAVKAVNKKWENWRKLNGKK